MHVNGSILKGERMHVRLFPNAAVRRKLTVKRGKNDLQIGCQRSKMISVDAPQGVKRLV